MESNPQAKRSTMSWDRVIPISVSLVAEIGLWTKCQGFHFSFQLVDNLNIDYNRNYSVSTKQKQSQLLFSIASSNHN